MNNNIHNNELSGVYPGVKKKDENTHAINGGFNPEDIPPAGVHPDVLNALNSDRYGPD